MNRWASCDINTQWDIIEAHTTKPQKEPTKLNDHTIYTQRHGESRIVTRGERAQGRVPAYDSMTPSVYTLVISSDAKQISRGIGLGWGWELTENKQVEIWVEGNILYLDCGGGYTHVHLPKFIKLSTWSDCILSQVRLNEVSLEMVERLDQTHYYGRYMVAN